MDDKPITIIVTIHPIKNGKRPVTVAAAPEGELPLMLSGVFAERHQLADRAYGTLLKRKPLTPKITAPKPVGAKTRGKPVAADKAAAEPEPDQIGPTDAPTAETPEAPAEESLPVIEGDDAGQMELELEGSNG